MGFGYGVDVVAAGAAVLCEGEIKAPLLVDDPFSCCAELLFLFVHSSVNADGGKLSRCSRKGSE